MSESGFMVDALKEALDIHMYVRGSYDRSDKDQQSGIQALTAHLAQWSEPTSEFDAACRKVMELAIKEAEETK